VCEKCSPTPLLLISSWSNNPSVARNSAWLTRALPKVAAAPGGLESLTTSGFLELPITGAIHKLIEDRGKARAMEYWGTYIYGALNDSASVHDLCGHWVKGSGIHRLETLKASELIGQCEHTC